MCRVVVNYVILLGLVVVTAAAASPARAGGPPALQGVYEFDGGGDGTSWEDAANWEALFADDGSPLSGDPATPPAPITSAEIPLTGAVSSAAGNTALDIYVGTAAGAGSLDVSGGDLTHRDAFVGGDGVGNLTVSGGAFDAGDDITIGGANAGVMSVSAGSASTGDDFTVGANGQLLVTGGTIFVGDRLITEGNAVIHNDGGSITADDDFFFFGSGQITNDSGSMVVFDKMRLDDATAKLTVNGGVVRSQELGFEDDGGTFIFEGVVEINGDGVYQSEQPDGPGDPISQLSLPFARQLIAEGVHLVTSEPGPFKLGAKTVIVPEFDGRTDVPFTQISVIVPEPGSALAAAWGCALLVAARRRRN